MRWFARLLMQSEAFAVNPHVGVFVYPKVPSPRPNHVSKLPWGDMKSVRPSPLKSPTTRWLATLLMQSVAFAAHPHDGVIPAALDGLRTSAPACKSASAPQKARP